MSAIDKIKELTEFAKANELAQKWIPTYEQLEQQIKDLEDHVKRFKKRLEQYCLSKETIEIHWKETKEND